jgi:hypothetical protein
MGSGGIADCRSQLAEVKTYDRGGSQEGGLYFYNLKSEI